MSDRDWIVWATPTRIVDGDTFVADLDLGWGTWRHDARVRVLDLWCPERSTVAGRGASDFAQELLIPVTLDVPLHVRLTSHALDSFGRCLASITLPDGRDFATAMIDAGHGTRDKP